MTPTQLRVQAAVVVCRAVGDAIKELGHIPSGHLYAHLCGVMSLEAYESVIQILIDAKLIRRSNHMLTWIGDTQS